MTVGNTGVALARQATEALRHFDDRGRSLRPDGMDHFSWSADVLDELARLAETLGRVVERVSGEDAPAAESHAHALATAIVAHRNSLLRHGAPGRPGARGDDRTRPRDLTTGHPGDEQLDLVG